MSQDLSEAEVMRGLDLLAGFTSKEVRTDNRQKRNHQMADEKANNLDIVDSTIRCYET